MTYLFTLIATGIAMFGKDILAQLFGQPSLFTVQCVVVGFGFVVGAFMDARAMTARRRKNPAVAAAAPAEPPAQP